jgi:hypothetical protein
LNLLNAFIINIDFLEKINGENASINFHAKNVLKITSNYLVFGIFDSYVDTFKKVSFCGKLKDIVDFEKNNFLKNFTNFKHE